jgi:hypothetical protein
VGVEKKVGKRKVLRIGIEKKEPSGFSERGTVLRQPDNEKLGTLGTYHCAIDKSERLWFVEG